MDDIDVAIIEILQREARISLKEIGCRVNLSLPATGERLKKLERAGYIKGYTALLDAQMFGRSYSCFCLLLFKEHNAEQERKFCAYVEQCADILACHRITGAYEYLLKIAARSPAHLEEILYELRAQCGVAKSSTYTVLSAIKDNASVAACIP